MFKSVTQSATRKQAIACIGHPNCEKICEENSLILTLNRKKIFEIFLFILENEN